MSKAKSVNYISSQPLVVTFGDTIDDDECFFIL